MMGDTIKWGEDLERDCRQYRALDATFMTFPDSPLHHDQRCGLCLDKKER